MKHRDTRLDKMRIKIPKSVSNIICTICGEFSGWTNSDLNKIDTSKFSGEKK